FSLRVLPSRLLGSCAGISSRRLASPVRYWSGVGSLEPIDMKSDPSRPNRIRDGLPAAGPENSTLRSVSLLPSHVARASVMIPGGGAGPRPPPAAGGAGSAGGAGGETVWGLWYVR